MSPSREIGVYVHIPYCVKKCPYCDFNSYGIASQESGHTAEYREEAYTSALLAELRHYAAQGWAGRPLRSVFFGGGTPSLFSSESIARVLEAILHTFPHADPEITLEANPGTVGERLGREKLEGFRAAGVNRISMGCQSFDPAKLQALGRIHSPKDIYAAVENIRSAAFDNFNLDLMFGIDGERLGSWRSDLEQALALGPPHLSAYGLTIEPGTEFWRRRRRGLLRLPDEDLQAEMYCLTQELLEAHGMRQYEVSNYALPGRECRHNLGYWGAFDYLGLGAGAHSYLALEPRSEGCEPLYAQRWSNIPKPSHYIERAASGGNAAQRRDPVDAEKAQLEFFYLGMRRASGVDLAEYEQRFAARVPDARQSALLQLEREALVERADTTVRLTKRGFLYCDYVLEQLA